MAHDDGVRGDRAVTKHGRELPVLLDVAGVAAHLGVTERYVRRLVAARRIPFIKWGHYVRFDPVEVEAWLDNARVEAISS